MTFLEVLFIYLFIYLFIVLRSNTYIKQKYFKYYLVFNVSLFLFLILLYFYFGQK